MYASRYASVGNHVANASGRQVSVNSMAKLLTRLAEGHESLSACITADCHDIVSCHTDITDNENQVEVNDALWAQTSTDAWSRKAFHSALHLQSSTDPTDMPAALALVGTARSLHSQRLSSVEDALIRFAEVSLRDRYIVPDTETSYRPD